MPGFAFLFESCEDIENGTCCFLVQHSATEHGGQKRVGRDGQSLDVALAVRLKLRGIGYGKRAVHSSNSENRIFDYSFVINAFLISTTLGRASFRFGIFF